MMILQGGITLNLDVYTITNLYEKTQNDIQVLFDYLNGRVNKRNICILNIQYYSNKNYAQFQYPNMITVFLGSLIDEFFWTDEEYTGRDRLLSILSLVMTHELYHADQNINPIHYTKDINYCDNAEKAAEYSAEIFCNSHKRDLMNLLNFKYCLVGKVTSPYGEYNKASVEDYYGNLLLGTFRNPEIYYRFLEAIRDPSIENLGVSIGYKDIYYKQSLVKFNGNLLDDRKHIGEFASMLMDVRKGIASCKYTMTITIGNSVGKGCDTVRVFHIEIVNIEYAPFIFE